MGIKVCIGGSRSHSLGQGHEHALGWVFEVALVNLDNGKERMAISS